MFLTDPVDRRQRIEQRPEQQHARSDAKYTTSGVRA